MTVIFLQFAYLWAIVLCLYTSGWLLLKADRNPVTRALVLCQMLIILWCLPQLCLSLPINRAIKYGLYGISYIGISFIGPSWLIFSFLYCQKPVERLAKWGLFCISAFDYAVFLTNEMHHLFYRIFTIEQVVYGPVFYVHMLYTYTCVLLGMGIVLRNFRKKQVSPVHMLVIILAAAIPLGFNLLYLSGRVKTGFDLTPPSFALSSILMLAAVFRYDFLDVNVLAFEHIFSSIAEGVVVYNKRGRITYCNKAAQKWLGMENGQMGEQLYQRLKKWAVQQVMEDECRKDGGDGQQKPSQENQILEDWRKEQGKISEDGQENLWEGNRAGESVWEKMEQMDNQLLFLPEGERLRLKHYLIRNKRGAVTAGALLLTDVQEYYERLRQSRELAVSEQRLAIEQERNRIAQEVHDTTGHTLTMIQSLIKLSRIAYTGEKQDREEGTVQKKNSVPVSDGKSERNGGKSKKEGVKETGRVTDEDTAEAYLSQAQALASQGIKELRWSINHLRLGNEKELVTEGVYHLAGSVKEIEVEVEIQGEDGPMYSHLSAIVYRCLREAITNCLKYADASHMDVIVKFAEKDLCLYIFDNGKGCASIQEHQGICGIKERVGQAGGQVRFLSAEGEGFQIYVKLPVYKAADPLYPSLW